MLTNKVKHRQMFPFRLCITLFDNGQEQKRGRQRELTVGSGVGAVVGEIVGARVGSGVGDVVGVRVGSIVGAAVGAELGTWVGLEVGDRVGASVGSTVMYEPKVFGEWKQTPVVHDTADSALPVQVTLLDHSE
jgi:hypothetical protein